MPKIIWTHSICYTCWYEKNPDREPVRMAPVVTGTSTCCFCGKQHVSGIFVREHSENTPHCPIAELE